MHYFLGLKVLYKDTGVLISQRKFATDLLKEYECLNYITAASPLDSTVKLKATEGKLSDDPTVYRKLVGKLNYLVNTRIDIAYSVQHLIQFLQTPREPYYKAALHVLRYLKNDPTLVVYLSNNPSHAISAYCDSDWAACPDSRRSVSSFIVFLRDNPISWKSKKQRTVSLSSVEAEYRSIRKVVGEIVWLERLLTEFDVALPKPINVFCDNQAAVHIAHNPVFHERTKHIEVDCHSVQDKLKEGLIQLQHVSTNIQLADILTKSLSGVKHHDVLSKLAVSYPLPT